MNIDAKPLAESLERVAQLQDQEDKFMASSQPMPLSERMKRAAELKRATANAMIVCASFAMEAGR